MFRDDALRPIVVRPVGDDEFDFVLLGEVPEVGIPVLAGLAAAGTFQVHDLDHARVNGCHIQGATGFEQDRFAELAKALQQGQNIGLEQGFTAGNFDQRPAEVAHFGDDIIE